LKTKTEKKHGEQEGNQKIPGKPAEGFHKDGFLFGEFGACDSHIIFLRLNPGDKAGIE
jgi:hypothetical protein